MTRRLGELSRTTAAADIPVPRPAELLLQDKAADCGRRCLLQLEADLRHDPQAYGLRAAATRMAIAFVEASSRPRPVASAGSDAEAAFLGEFTDQVVAGYGIVDAVGRRAAVKAGLRLLDGELFCLVYRLFFADIVAEFVRAVVVEQVKAALPGLPLVDPGDVVAEWVADKVFSLVPDPCEAVAGRLDPVIDIAKELVSEAVDAALGLGTPRC